MNGNNKPLVTVQDPQFKEIFLKKGQDGIENNITEDTGSSALTVRGLCSDFRKPVNLADMILNAVIRVVQQVPVQVPDTAAGIHEDMVMGILPAPAALATIPQPQLLVGIPPAAPDPFAAVIGQTIKKHGRINILVNNAGIHLGGPFWEETEELWDHLYQTNVLGTALPSQAVVRHVKDHKGV